MRKITNGFFITGTDTGVGKTVIAASLLRILANYKLKTVAIKPVATGGVLLPSGIHSIDALVLQKYATYKIDYKLINPFVFKDPIAPNIAAKLAGVELSVEKILEKTNYALSHDADCVVIEGAGGVCVPLNSQETMVDLIKAYDYPVILVVGIKLGCINHALLSIELLVKSQIKIFGWIANVIDPKMQAINENVEAIKQHTNTSFLGTVGNDADLHSKKHGI